MKFLKGLLLSAMNGDTKITKIDGNFDVVINKAQNVLARGEIVAAPTDTIYGLMTLIDHSEKLYDLKGRSINKPLGVFVHSPELIEKYAVLTVPLRLLNILYPGPCTLLFKRLPTIPSQFNHGSETIGFRIPQNKLVRELCRVFPHQLIAQTSANISGSPTNPVCIEDFKEIWPRIDMIIDSGKINEFDDSSLGSTVIDLSTPEYYRIIRDGCSGSTFKRVLEDAGLKEVPASL